MSTASALLAEKKTAAVCASPSVGFTVHVRYVSGRLSTSRSVGNAGVRNCSVTSHPAPANV